MSDKNYLRKKQCACCYIRLDKLTKRGIQAIKSQELLDKLNAAKPTILEKRNKPTDENVIQTDDLVCKTCINFINRQSTTTSKKRKRTLSIHHLFRDRSTASTSRDPHSLQHSTYEEEPEVDREQNTTIYPDLSHLMGMESHTNQREETAPMTSSM